MKSSFRKLLILTAITTASFRVCAQQSFPYDTRSDSIYVYHYDIALDFRNFSAAELNGSTRVYFSALVNGISNVNLDLLGPDLDSVKSESGAMLAFTAGEQDFTVTLPSALNATDSSWFDVYFHGDPVIDNEFGGFYYSGFYAYNVGVSLSDIPHNYGKTWFPCQDNFVNRSTYDFYITTLPAHAAACGGTLVTVTVNGDLSETHHWRIDQTIPSYLASVAVSDYVFVNKNFSGVNGNMPVKIASRVSDSTSVNGSFQHLEDAFDIYEDKFGPYRWDRVGYAMTPMTGGAMEHAMNIAYPLQLTTGNLAYQSVMAHELSHHWWGNLVTCRTAEDMWINEGSASYCEYVFTEGLDGREQYEDEIRGNHKNLLRTCHIQDGGYWPLSGVPQEHTYGQTTYSKGADILHTLRAYLGDEDFFGGLEQLLEDNKFSDMDAIEYRDDLSEITGVDLDNFFSDWIFQGGWPHIAVDSIESTQSGIAYSVDVHLRQKLTGRTNYSHHVPVTVTFRDNDWNIFETKIYSEGHQNTVNVAVPFNPTVVSLNEDELISHAVTAEYSVVESTGTKNLTHANLMLSVQSVTDSALVIAEHNWTAPDPVQNNPFGYGISPQRYWRIDGIFPAGFSTKATFRYSGTVSGSNGYLDNLLITGLEDSLVLLYRPDSGSDWTEAQDYEKNLGNTSDKVGSMVVENLQKGEYAFAMKGQPLGAADNVKQSKVKLFPNPAGKTLKVSCERELTTIVIYSVSGQIAAEFRVSGKEAEVDISSLAPGSYYCSGYDDQTKLFSVPMVKQ